MRPALLLVSILCANNLVAGFKLPLISERVAALGDISNEPMELQRMLAPDNDYGLIPVPGPDDWLTSHVEPGQTYDQFVRSGANRPDEKRRIIYLQPIGGFSTGSSFFLETLRNYLAAYYQMEVRILPAEDVDIMEMEPRINPHTKQLQILTRKVLDFLSPLLPDDAYCLLGVTMQDLYPHRLWNFVFGQASLRDRVGVYSFARHDPEFFGQPRPDDFGQLLLRRGLKVTSHETGHMFGLPHCIYYDCSLNGSNNLNESDARTMHLCPVCLRKLHHAIGFDPVKRYEDLARFYRRHDWEAEADWCKQQIAKTRQPAANTQSAD